MSAITIQARGLSVLHGHPLHKRGCYIDVALNLDDQQIKDALYTLIGALPEPQVAQMLREEFPSLFTESA